MSGRCRPNTLRAVAFDLKAFFLVVGKDPVLVTAADVFDFVADQRGDRTVIRLSDRESGCRRGRSPTTLRHCAMHAGYRSKIAFQTTRAR